MSRYVERYGSRKEAEARSEWLASRGAVTWLEWEPGKSCWRLAYTQPARLPYEPYRCRKCGAVVQAGEEVVRTEAFSGFIHKACPVAVAP